MLLCVWWHSRRSQALGLAGGAYRREDCVALVRAQAAGQLLARSSVNALPACRLTRSGSGCSRLGVQAGGMPRGVGLGWGSCQQV